MHPNTWKFLCPCIRVQLCIYLDDLPALSRYVDAPEHMNIFSSMYSDASIWIICTHKDVHCQWRGGEKKQKRLYGGQNSIKLIHQQKQIFKKRVCWTKSVFAVEKLHQIFETLLPRDFLSDKSGKLMMMTIQQQQQKILFLGFCC